ncbi:MAG: hypothetical protein ABR578_09850 [Chromatocurvus sp.]
MIRIRPLLDCVALGLVCAASAASAAEWRVGGHLKFQGTASLQSSDDLVAVEEGEHLLDYSADARLKLEGRQGRFGLVIHDQLLATGGDRFAALSSFADSYSTLSSLVGAGVLPQGANPALPSDDRRALDLEHRLHEGSRSEIVHRLDRMYLSYSDFNGFARLGRQVFTWGNGLVFNPMDFINPFPPTTIDTEYKIGEDMLYGQTLIPSGDLQAAYVMRRDEMGDIEGERASTALKYRAETAAGSVDVALAHHYDETVVGLGWSRPLRDALVRVDLLWSDTVSGDAISAVANVDYSWTWFGHNTYGFLEYYRNGFGTGSTDLAQLDQALFQRMERGEVFTFGRNYLSTGFEIDLTPLLKARPTGIVNLDDHSGVALLRFEYEWRGDRILHFGLDIPFGERGSEFGGLSIPGTSLYSTPARQLFIRLAWYV